MFQKCRLFKVIKSKSWNVPGNSFCMSKNPDMGKNRKSEKSGVFRIFSEIRSPGKEVFFTVITRPWWANHVLLLRLDRPSHVGPLGCQSREPLTDKFLIYEQRFESEGPLNQWKLTKSTRYMFQQIRGVFFAEKKPLRDEPRPRGAGRDPEIDNKLQNPQDTCSKNPGACFLPTKKNCGMSLDHGVLGGALKSMKSDNDTQM